MAPKAHDESLKQCPLGFRLIAGHFGYCNASHSTATTGKPLATYTTEWVNAPELPSLAISEEYQANICDRSVAGLRNPTAHDKGFRDASISMTTTIDDDAGWAIRHEVITKRAPRFS
jgi:hypothetical protein